MVAMMPHGNEGLPSRFETRKRRRRRVKKWWWRY